MNELTSDSNAATLVAIALAARRAGDRELERTAKNALEAKHGIKLTISRGQEREGAKDA